MALSHSQTSFHSATQARADFKVAFLVEEEFHMSLSRPTLEQLEDRNLLSFLPAVFYGAGTQPQSVAFGDFSHQGFLDLATANFGSNDVSVLSGRGNGTFRSAVNYPAGLAPNFIVAGDFNRDGILDLAEANAYSDNVSVLLGNGDGTFKAPVSFPTGARTVYVATGDFNGDGILDLAVANQVSSTVSILIGKGDGSFRSAVNYSVSGHPVAVAIGDFNGDGKPDIAVVNGGSNTLTILLGKGDGTFQSPVSYPTGINPNGVAAGDFNGDGFLDLAVANQGTNNVSIFLGNGDGTFQAKVDYPTGLRPVSVVTADFTHRGKLDLAVSNGDGNSVSLLTGNGDGTFQPKVDYPVGASPGFLAVADLNNDGYPDLVVPSLSDNGVYIILNQPDATHFQIVAPLTITAGSPFSVTTTALGPSNAIATGYTGRVSFSSSDGFATIPSTYVFTAADNGVHTFDGVRLFSAGVRLITASDGKITGITPVVVNPAAAAAFYLDAPASVVAGTSFDMTVYAFDAYGNFASGYNGMVSFSSSDPSAVIPPDHVFSRAEGGIASFPGEATLLSQGVQSITVQDKLGLLSDTASITVLPANAPPGRIRTDWLFAWLVEKSGSRKWP
jgi:hypothetical protein